MYSKRKIITVALVLAVALSLFGLTQVFGKVWTDLPDYSGGQKRTQVPYGHA